VHEVHGSRPCDVRKVSEVTSVVVDCYLVLPTAIRVPVTRTAVKTTGVLAVRELNAAEDCGPDGSTRPVGCAGVMILPDASLTVITVAPFSSVSLNNRLANWKLHTAEYAWMETF
jgi:hypothetical protein